MSSRPFARRHKNEARGELSSAECALSKRKWLRAPEHDRRIRRGDDFAGDAWCNARTGDIRYVAVGRAP